MFTSADFAPSFVTDQDLISETVPNSSGTTQQLLQNEFAAEQSTSSCIPKANLVENVTVELIAQSVILSGYEESNLVSCYIPPASIMPLPKASPKKRSNRKKGKSRVYTNTPNRDEVAKQGIEKAGKKSKKSAKNVKRKLFLKNRGLLNMLLYRRHLMREMWCMIMKATVIHWMKL